MVTWRTGAAHCLAEIVPRLKGRNKETGEMKGISHIPAMTADAATIARKSRRAAAF
jgi:hypothetical protein